METPKLVNVEQVCDGWVKKYLLTYELPNGKTYSYEAASRKGPDAFKTLLEANGKGLQRSSADAVCIVARTPRDTLVMEREFRYPLNSWCVALPAGLVDEGEDIATCAARELREETGYAVIPDAPVRPLPQPGYSSTGLTDETVHVIFVEAEIAGPPQREGNELIKVFELPIADIRNFLDANTLPIGTRAQLILELFA